MRRKTIVFNALLALFAWGAVRAEEPPEDLIVHEWGTFLSVSGSDGVTLDGMYHEEHALPAFVHARGREQLRIPSVRLKGETPVIYFYTDRPREISVEVRFPRGLWTQWYPQAQLLGPPLSQAESPPTLRDGMITWDAELVPSKGPGPFPALPRTSADALWNFARDVDAAYVRTRHSAKDKDTREVERFLFYRGLGRAVLPLRLDASAGGTLALGDDGPKGVSHVFVIRVEGGKGVYTYRPSIAPGERLTGVIPALERAEPLDALVPRLADDLAARLVESGLYPKEARAMVNTWSASYFKTEGTRALFVLPQAWTNGFIPLAMSPTPKELVRVMVGRLELLSPEREHRAERAVLDLAAPDETTRRRAFTFLREQGRYAEPVVRRVLQTTRDERVKSLGQRLLATDFVTDLRSALASKAKDPTNESVHVRAQLASLLREIGLDSEAKTEGAAVVAALKKRPAPALDNPESRQYLRAFARALEGLGDDRGAARRYEEFVRFGSQVGRSESCVGCHTDAGPRDVSWFRDWWAGRKFAQTTERIGRSDAAIAEHEAALNSHPDNLAARMLLAYLYEAKGQKARAKALWDAVIPKPEKALSE